MIRDLLQYLTQADLAGWQVHWVRQRSDQLYLNFQEVESLRRVDTETFKVTIHLHLAQEGKSWLGESTFTLNPGEDLAGELAQAQERATLALNPVFSLPGPAQQYRPLNLVDPELRDRPRQALWQVRGEMERAMAKLAPVELAAAELFCNYEEIEVFNHLGLHGAYATTTIETHFALLAAAAGEEAESLGVQRARFLSDLQIAAVLARYSRYAMDNLRAELPPCGRFPVIFGEEALDSLFHHLCSQASGEAAFQGWSRLQVGQPVIRQPQRDLLTITSDPWLPGALGSRPFDGHGLALRPVTFIQENLLQHRLADSRYAAYLQVEPTGAVTNVVVAPGRATLAEMLAAEPVLHLLRFSTLEPDPVTGALSGEIRTGYLHQHGRSRPLKGGSVAGNLEEALRFLTLSRETEQRERYCGPLGIRLEDMAIAGA